MRQATARIKRNRRWLFYCFIAAIALSPLLLLRKADTVRAASPFDATDPDGELPPNTQLLNADDVKAAIRSAAMAVDDTRLVIAVTDRQGNPLAVFRKFGAPATAEGNFGIISKTEEVAVALARTASFFSNTQAPLSSRTVRFISGIHFPPGIMFVAQAALYGIENTNRGCGSIGDDHLFHEFSADFIPGKEVPASRSIDRSRPGLGILTGKKAVDDHVPFPVEANFLKGAVNPGGIPLYKGGRLVGGIGVVGIPGVPGDFSSDAGYFAGTIAEYAALIGAAAPKYDSTALHPQGTLFKFPAYPGVVIIDGISLPFVDKHAVFPSVLSGKQLPGTQAVPAGTPLENLGTFMPLGTKAGELPPPLTQIDPKTNKRLPVTSHGKPVTATSVAYDSPGVVPEGYLVEVKAGPLGGLTKEEVQKIFDQSLAEANMTRALIRLPVGVRAKFVIAVSDLDGQLLGLYRMKDATIFSIDVAVTKSRNVIYFTGQRQADEMPGLPVGTAVTNRTIEFGAQPLYPPGIDYSGPGPWFNLFQNDVANACTQGAQPPNKYQSGIVFFPGAVPIYKNGVMVGGLGISGDGVDQDDFATVGGALGFYAPNSIRADQFKVGRNPNGFGPNSPTRLPYTKFPRQPTL